MNEMIRDWTFSRGPATARLLIVAALVAAVLVLLTLKTGLAAEFSTPPGIDVASQESALRERVVRAARGMLGENFVDAEVHINYLRTGQGGQAGQPSGGDRVKLPGFNNFIVPSTGTRSEIIPEFSRIRQAIVMVSDQARVQAESLARELIAQTGMDPAQGDTLRVVMVNAAQRGQERAPELPPVMPGMGRESEARTQPPKTIKPMTPEELREPQSTAHLMQARRHYFAGDYQGSLDEILLAIQTDPNNAQAYAMLGSLYYAMNWRNLAVKYWQRSLEIDPSNREIEDLVTQIRIQSP